MEKNIYELKDQKQGKDIYDYKTRWNVYEKILKKIKIQKDEKILDAGCGDGELSKFLKIKELYGFDFSEKAVQEAKKKNYKQIIKSQIIQTPFKNKEFDQTICIQVFQYIKEPSKSFKELLRITKGEIILSVPNFNLLRIRSFFSNKEKKRYKFCVENENYTDSKFLEKLAKENNLRLKIRYISNKWGGIRNLFGIFLSSEVVGIFKRK